MTIIDCTTIHSPRCPGAAECLLSQSHAQPGYQHWTTNNYATPGQHVTLSPKPINTISAVERPGLLAVMQLLPGGCLIQIGARVMMTNEHSALRHEVSGGRSVAPCLEAFLLHALRHRNENKSTQPPRLTPSKFTLASQSPTCHQHAQQPPPTRLQAPAVKPNPTQTNQPCPPATPPRHPP